MKIIVEISHEEIVGLMRSLSRSLEKTPGRELDLHAKLYSKLGGWHTRTLPPALVKRIGRAMDGAVGR